MDYVGDTPCSRLYFQAVEFLNKAIQADMASMHRMYALITRAWPYWVLAIILMVAKFQLIAFYGNGTPFWDQWDAEADYLYRPWLEGHYDWQKFFSPHNEHRILTARVLALLLFELGGEKWNPLLQMKVNAVLHVGAICVLLYFLSKVIHGGYRTALFLFAGILFAIPFGWENTLAGFQSQFYLLLLFSFVFLWAMSMLPCFSVRWWMGLLAGVLSAFTMASGALTMLAGGLILLIRRYWFGERRAVALSAIVLILGVALLAIHYTPTIPGHVTLKADSLFAFMKALVRIVAWPASQYGEGLFFIQVPLLVWVLHILWRRSDPSPRPAGLVFILAMALWLYGQFVSIAYGRSTQALSPRYLDLFAIGLMLNWAALLYLLASVPSDSRQLGARHVNSAIFLWLSVVAFGFIKSGPKLAEDLSFKARTGNEQEKNVRNYLCSGDYSYLLNKPSQFIPYPDPARLKSLLDNPVIRRILPGNINEALAEKKVAPDGEPYCNSGELQRAFEVIKTIETNRGQNWVTLNSVIESSWYGKGINAGDLLGFKVIGSFSGSDKDTGILVLHIRRGQSLAYRSGARGSGQAIIISNSDGQQFSTELPVAVEWSVLQFSNPLLAEEFTVSFIDSGTRWGEWSAVGLME